MSAATENLFGRISLGYVVAESRKLPEWERFARDGLGLHVQGGDHGSLAIRIDNHQSRLLITKGAAEDVVALGWQLQCEDALTLQLERLHARGIKVQRIDGEQARKRGVERYWSFEGPKRIRFEMFVQALHSETPLQMLSSGFVTAEHGMGHVAITTREPEAMLAFFQQLFDARLSDTIEDKLNGITLELSFLRLNPRHHSVAVAATRGTRMNPLRTAIHHLNLQARSLEDVTQAYQRTRKLGYSIASAIGQHPNDRELSFYVTTPSGFEIEIGWNPVEVDPAAENAWQPGHYQGISLWGHFPEGLTLSGKLSQMVRGLGSLMRKEFTVGART